MTESKTDVMWFTSMKGTVGIVRLDHSDGTTLYYISEVEGKNEQADIDFILEWGAKFPQHAGDALFSKSMLCYEDKVVYGNQKSISYFSDVLVDRERSTPKRKSARIK